MLSQIIGLLKSADRPLSLDQLSRQVAVERSALEAMLAHLVQKRKINRISPSTSKMGEKQAFSFCAGCQTKAYCADSNNKPTYYTLKGN